MTVPIGDTIKSGENQNILMKKNLQSKFDTRQHMLSKDFEIYYYDDHNLKKVENHMHDYYEYYFFLEGNASIQAGGKLYPVHHGDIMLIPPRLFHRPIIHSQEKPYRRFVFWISKAYCNLLKEMSDDYMYLFHYVQHNKSYLFHNDKIIFNTIQSKILGLLEEIRTDKFGHKAMTHLYANDLILHINRLIYERNHPIKVKDELSLYQQLNQYVNIHLDEDLSLDRLACEFFVSKYHISHIFKANTGLSIHQYITKKRLHACREAILSNNSITKVFQLYGFGDYSSFFRAFKKEYGISPKELRDMQTVTH